MNKDGSIANFNKFQLKPKEFIEIKYCILHKANDKPKFLTSGVLAGMSIDTIVIEDETKKSASQEFYDQLFRAPFEVHVARTFLYFFVSVISIFVIVFIMIFPINFIKKYFSKILKKQKFKNYKKIHKIRGKGRELLEKLYLDNDNQCFYNIIAICRQPSLTKSLLQMTKLKQININSPIYYPQRIFGHTLDIDSIIVLLNNEGIIFPDNEQIDPAFVDEIEMIYNYFIKINASENILYERASKHIALFMKKV